MKGRRKLLHYWIRSTEVPTKILNVTTPISKCIWMLIIDIELSFFTPTRRNGKPLKWWNFARLRNSFSNEKKSWVGSQINTQADNSSTARQIGIYSPAKSNKTPTNECLVEIHISCIISQFKSVWRIAWRIIYLTVINSLRKWRF